MLRDTHEITVLKSCVQIENEILVYSQPVKEELNNTEAVGTQHTAETQSGIEAKVENVEHIPDPDSPSKLLVTREQASVKVRPKLIITPKNKKKRGKRKARAGRWSKKSSEQYQYIIGICFSKFHSLI